MKRALLILALLPAIGDAQTFKGASWSCSLDDKFDSPSLCMAAPGSGLRLYITDVIAQGTTTTAGFFQLYHARSVATGGPADCGALAELATNMFPAGTIGTTPPLRFIAAGNAVTPTRVDLETPLIVPVDRDFCVEGDASNSITIQVMGYIAP